MGVPTVTDPKHKIGSFAVKLYRRLLYRESIENFQM